MKQESPKRCEQSKKNKNYCHNKRYKKDIKKGENEK